MTTGIGLFFIKEIDDHFKHTTLIYTEPSTRFTSSWSCPITLLWWRLVAAVFVLAFNSMIDPFVFCLRSRILLYCIEPFSLKFSRSVLSLFYSLLIFMWGGELIKIFVLIVSQPAGNQHLRKMAPKTEETSTRHEPFLNYFFNTSSFACFTRPVEVAGKAYVLHI
jgi:hypothetical protein